MKASMTLVRLSVAGLLALSVFAFAEEQLSKREQEFAKKFTAECRKNRRTEYGEGRGHPIGDSMSGENPYRWKNLPGYSYHAGLWNHSFIPDGDKLLRQPVNQLDSDLLYSYVWPVCLAGIKLYRFLRFYDPISSSKRSQYEEIPVTYRRSHLYPVGPLRGRL